MVSKQSYRHREWHIRKELFGYKTEFEITYLLLYSLSAFVLFDKYGFSLKTVVIAVAGFWLLMIGIIIVTVEVERFMKWRVGCKENCDHPNIFLKD